MLFDTKNYLKNNRYHNSKHPLNSHSLKKHDEKSNRHKHVNAMKELKRKRSLY